MTVQGYQRVFFEPVSATTLTPSVELGTRRQEAGSEYCYIYNGGGASMFTGAGCIMSLFSGYTVTVSSTTQVDAFFGVAPNSINTGYYGWVQTRGMARAVMSANNSAAAGDNLMAGTDGKFAVNSVATGYQAPSVGRALEAIASGGSGRVYFRGLN